MHTGLFYSIKPLIPRRVQLFLRRILAARKLKRYSSVWPIDYHAATPPTGWKGWPENKKFALVLTHDVDTQKGHDSCLSLMGIEKKLQFVSSFNFVPERYRVSRGVQNVLSQNGFEIGVHGLKHDGKLFTSREGFLAQAEKINAYIREWGAVGFRAPSMIRNLEWIKDLSIEYDSSTFDTDPFEPQPEGVGTIFPFHVGAVDRAGGYVELPYTLSQDFTPFVLLQRKDISIWNNKLDWIAEKGGMALINTHPDYMNFSEKPCGNEEYPAAYYREFLEYVRDMYADNFWHALPRDVARFWAQRKANLTVQNTATDTGDTGMSRIDMQEATASGYHEI
jgi:hypothetical protein